MIFASVSYVRAGLLAFQYASARSSCRSRSFGLSLAFCRASKTFGGRSGSLGASVADGSCCGSVGLGVGIDATTVAVALGGFEALINLANRRLLRATTRNARQS